MASFSATLLLERSKFGLNELLDRTQQPRGLKHRVLYCGNKHYSGQNEAAKPDSKTGDAAVCLWARATKRPRLGQAVQ